MNSELKSLDEIKNDYIFLFVFEYPFNFIKYPFCSTRKEHINNPKNLDKNDSIIIWRLLQKATMMMFGRPIDTFNPRKLESGKWICDDFCFSLSHSAGVYAVAISNKNIGVDVQKVREIDFISRGTFSNSEIEHLDIKHSWLHYEWWTKKEALYKWLDNKKPFCRETWKDYDTTSYLNLFYSLNFASSRHDMWLSVCSETISSNLKVITNINSIKEELNCSLVE